MLQLEQKTAVITGASSGIGRSMALAFAREGARVVVNYNNSVARAETVVSEIRSNGGHAVAIQANVGHPDQVENLIRTTQAEFGKIDIWVNNAGVMYGFPKEDLIDMEKAENTFNVNFFGALFGCRTAIKNMKSGIIMTINSTSGLDATRALNYKIYAASKWAVRGFLQAFKAENLESSVKILSVYPGGIKTELYGETKPDSFNQFMEPDYVNEKIIANLKLENPEVELIIKRPTL